MNTLAASNKRIAQSYPTLSTYPSLEIIVRLYSKTKSEGIDLDCDWKCVVDVIRARMSIAVGRYPGPRLRARILYSLISHNGLCPLSPETSVK